MLSLGNKCICSPHLNFFILSFLDQVLCVAKDQPPVLANTSAWPACLKWGALFVAAFSVVFVALAVQI